MYDTAFMYMIGDNDNNRWGTCLLPEFVAAYEAKKTAGSYEAYNAAMKELQALADEQVVGLALCWDKAYFPYRTDTMRLDQFPRLGRDQLQDLVLHPARSLIDAV